VNAGKECVKRRTERGVQERGEREMDLGHRRVLERGKTVNSVKEVGADGNLEKRSHPLKLDLIHKGSYDLEKRRGREGRDEEERKRRREIEGN
jgi:hypothetical protein